MYCIETSMVRFGICFTAKNCVFKPCVFHLCVLHVSIEKGNFSFWENWGKEWEVKGERGKEKKGVGVGRKVGRRKGGGVWRRGFEKEEG